MNRALDITLKLSTAQAQLSRRLAGQLGSIHGLGLSDLAILVNLTEAAGGRMRRTDLADRLALTPSGVTRALLPLERVGLVTRQPDARDARVGYACITETGRVRTAEALETAADVAAEVFGATWKQSELASLSGFLERLGGVGLPASA